MLSIDTLLHCGGVEVADVTCRHGRGRGRPEEQHGYGLVFVRRGCFRRNADGVETMLDPTAAYFTSAGVEERYDHPHAHGDDCTFVGLDAELAASMWGGEPTLPPQPLRSSPALDLDHRLLLAAARRGDDRHGVVERVALAADALAHVDPRRVAAGRPTTVRARRALVEGAREALCAAPGLSLAELSRQLAVSPHHLSRVFRGEMGHTISRHRLRLRTRAALERLAGGERDLARLAADLGFADHSHLCRAVRGETGGTPSALRALLTHTRT